MRRDERAYSVNSNILPKNKTRKSNYNFQFVTENRFTPLQIDYNHNEMRTNSTDEATEKAQITPPIFIILFMIKDFNLFIENMKIQQNFEFSCRNTTNKLKINTFMKNSYRAINHNNIIKRKKNVYTFQTQEENCYR